MFTLESSAFRDGERIPVQHARPAVPGGRNMSIPYSWSSPPAGTRSFALALVDIAPVANNWVHWLVVDLPAESRELVLGASGSNVMPEGARELLSTYRTSGYGGPNPPIGTGDHPYVATIYALDVERLTVPAVTTLDTVRRVIAGHVLASATCTGYFSRD